MKSTISTFCMLIGMSVNPLAADVTKQASPTDARRYNGGPAKAAEKAHRDWPSLAIVKSATKSPTLLAQPRKVKPITAFDTFQNVP